MAFVVGFNIQKSVNILNFYHFQEINHSNVHKKMPLIKLSEA